MKHELLKKMDTWLTEGFALRAEIEIAFKQESEASESVFEAARQLMKNDDLEAGEVAAVIGTERNF